MSDDVSLKEFRKGVQKIFADALNIGFVPGTLDGPNKTGEWRGSCLVRRLAPVQQRQAEANVDIEIRVFRPYEQPSPAIPFDPEPLEDLADTLLQVVAQNQTGLPGGAWYLLLSSLEIDDMQQGVACRLVAWQSNPAGT